MGIFGKKIKDQKDKPLDGAVGAPLNITSVQVLGSGCANCRALEQAVKEALKQLGVECDIGHVSDFAQIAAFGVMTTPALAVNGKVVSSGKVLKVGEAAAILRKAGET